MCPDGWHLTDDIDDFLAHAGDFLRSRAALHNTPLADIENLRTRGADPHGAEATVFGRLESGGEVRAISYRTPRGGLGTLTPPRSRPEGRGRITGGTDREQVVCWCREFPVDIGEKSVIDLIDAASRRAATA
ncbi:hypothetical protein GCM10010121_044760 [Streptomyces brasiliensis]|uniref:Uncharacterized protein n=1 Tax=Streptomyces brasiliensis TaxID=1954 RepID=A0A917NU63_9ACTN|nr:hypothetical protein GCM10010121_044760 [Streptomyces brasiliensis]